MRALVAWHGGLFLTERKIGMWSVSSLFLVCVFSIFNAGGSICGCICVYTHTGTNTHTVQMGYSDVSPGFGTRNLKDPKNPDGLNLGIFIFVYVYKVHMCIYMLGGGMRSWDQLLFSSTYFSFPKRKAKDVNANH